MMNFKLTSVLKWAPLLLRRKRNWALLAIAGSSAWASVQDFTVDQLWKEPRDVLVDRIEDARDVQESTAEEFQTALESFQSITGHDGGELQDKFETLSSALERSEKSAGKVKKRIDRVSNAANRLLDEWKDELKTYSNKDLKRRAEEQFDSTRCRCEDLIQHMRQSEDKLEPVLNAFRDQVLYLKHNLNASAIASLQEDTREIQQDVQALINEMQASISEADAFLKSLQEEQSASS